MPNADLAIPAPPALPATETASPAALYLASLGSLESRRSMHGCLRRLAQLITGTPEADPNAVPWGQLRYAHTVAIRSAICGNDWSPSYVNKHLAALTGVLKQAWRLGHMTSDDYHRARDLPYIVTKRLPVGRSVALDEFTALLRSCHEQDGPVAYRDAAIIAVLRSTGARRSEVAGMLIENYDRTARSVKIVGKGGHERLVYLQPAAAGYLDQWLSMLGRSGPMFRRIGRSGKILGVACIDPSTIGKMLERHRRQAGLAHLSSHDARRTFAGDLLDKGADLALVQKLMGHASPVTTSSYDRRPGRSHREAVDRLDLVSPEQLQDAES